VIGFSRTSPALATMLDFSVARSRSWLFFAILSAANVDEENQGEQD
jgi:hypothetical protein